MSRVESVDLPEYMTWEELEQLPEEIANQIELWDGRVVWVRRGPAEHQRAMFNVTAGLKRGARAASERSERECWTAELETNVFFGSSGKSDFLTPDFIVYYCVEQPFDDVHANRVVVAGEVLSPSNTHSEVEAKKRRYAAAGIPWYWEVALDPQTGAVVSVRAYVLQEGAAGLPEGVSPLYKLNYLLAAEWCAEDEADIAINYPFPIRIPWSELRGEQP